MTRRIVLLAVSVVALGGIGAVWLLGRAAPGEVVIEPGSDAVADSQAVMSAGSAAHTARVAVQPSRDVLSAEEQAVVDAIIARLHGPLTSARVQLRLIEELVRYVQARYPDTWREELRRLLQAGFPEHASALLELWARSEAYAGWLESTRDELAALTPAERRALTWDARHAMYGDAADEIFEAARRNEAVADALAGLDARPEGTLGSRFGSYLDTIGEQYGDEAEGFVDRHRQEVLDRFLGLGSVQDELAGLGAEARRDALRSLREAAGMDAPALDRWSRLDRLRDERWAAGREYMRLREAALRSLSGDELARALDELRRRVFGAEAETIAGEEASGYFRFGERQSYGQN